MNSGAQRPNDGETLAHAPTLAADGGGTLADSSRTLDSANGLPSPAPHLSSCTDSTCDATMAADPDESAEGASRPSDKPQAMAAYSTLGRAFLSPSSVADTQQATLDVGASASGATTDFGGDLGPRIARTIQGAVVAAASAVQNGPADYEVLGELGRGGMGVVYKARHRRLNRLVALKMIRGAQADEVQLARFKIEAEAVAALRHTNILQIYDIGECNGSPYVALELLEGGSLFDKLRATLLPPRQAALWMVPLIMAMDTAHRAGIVHRDLKPANVLFSADGIPKITDFGLAKRLEDDEGQTHTGQIMGTPSYMAPEQARGDTKLAGPAADIYSLGAMLYEMLTGRPPFKGTSAMETVKLVLEVEPVSPSRVQYRVPRDLEIICLKCLRKEPRKRYATAKEIADDLNRYLAGEPIKARRTSLAERGVKWTKRHPTVALGSALGTVALVGLCAYGLWYWSNQRSLQLVAQRHEAEARKETNDDLFRAQEAISRNDLNQAHEFLTARKVLLEREGPKSSELTSLYDRTKLKLGEVDRALEAARERHARERARDEVQRRFGLFLDHRKEALFRDTQFTGLMVPANLELTREAAEAGLSVFARRGDSGDWTLGALPAALSSDQQTEVKDGCHELLLILAGAMAAQSPAHVGHGLRALENADRLRPGRSRAYHLTKAAILAKNKDAAGEARELAEARRIRPEASFDHFLSGQQEYKRNRLPEAIQAFEIALRQKPDYFWANCLLAICYIQTSRFEGAKSCLNGCLQTDPDFAWLYLLRGFASGQLGAKYHNLVKDSPGREAALSASAEFEFNEAEADLHQALEKLARRPDDELHYVLLVNRGLIRFQRGRLDQAAADYQEAIRLKKDPYIAHAELAHVYQKQNKAGQAIEQFGRAIALRPDWAPLYRGRAEVLQGLADSTPEQRKAARDDLKMAILHEKIDNPVSIKDHINLGVLLYRDGDYEHALDESELALGSLPKNVDARVLIDAHVLRVQSLLKLKRFDEAIHSCDVAIALGKKSPLLYELRGDANAAHHNYPDAIRDYGRALEGRPDDSRLLARRGWVYLVYESPKLALADFEAAIKMGPSSGDAWTGRGSARAQLGDHVGAVADAREAVRKAGPDARIIYNAARIHAVAASVLAAGPGENGRQARQLAVKYQETAIQLIREAFEKEAPEKRTSLWRDTVVLDPALQAIRRRLKFEQLLATTK